MLTKKETDIILSTICHTRMTGDYLSDMSAQLIHKDDAAMYT